MTAFHEVTRGIERLIWRRKTAKGKCSPHLFKPSVVLKRATQNWLVTHSRYVWHCELIAQTKSAFAIDTRLETSAPLDLR